MGQLTHLAIKNAKPGRHVDGKGLCLIVKPSGARSWVLRVQVDGKRRDVGLGAVDLTRKRDPKAESADDTPVQHKAVLTLEEARQKADFLRRAAKAGHDPVLVRDKDKKAPPTFRKATEACHSELKAGWAAKNAAAFLSSLEDHAFAKLGNLRVDHIEASHIRDMLAPIWLEIPVMARKVRQRVNAVLNYAKSKGWRTTEVPERSVTIGLPRQRAGGNFKAMPYADVPDFVKEVRGEPVTLGRLALLLTIFTAARSGEVRSAKWSHVDLERKIWTRPAALMKTKTEHVVTLNDSAIAVLKDAAKLRTTQADCLIFPGKGSKSLSDMTLTKVLRDAGLPYAAHGFRSSFRDWAAEKMPHIPEAVAEAALAHVVPDKVVRAYKRTTFLEMRRQLLDAWGAFCSDGLNRGVA